MATEKQKYLSVSLRTSGFALLTPLAFLVFQWIVFKKDFFTGNFNSAVITSLLGIIFITGGYLVLKEK